jgi:hypothetical protein
VTGWFVTLDLERTSRAERARRFLRALLSLPELSLRLGWLDSELRSAPAAPMAELLEQVIEDSETSTPDAREALITIALWTAGHAADETLEKLRAAAFAERHVSLQRVIRRVAPPSLPPEPAEPRVPDYGTGRELSLGERRSLARRADRDGFDRLLRDPHPMVLRQLLGNPRTTEADVVRVTAFRPARPSLIQEVARTHWLTRSRVRMSILQNPGAPPSVAVPLVGLCTSAELGEIVRACDVQAIVRLTAGELLELRPRAGRMTTKPPPESMLRPRPSNG